MKEENFNKGIADLKSVRLTAEEKAVMLENILKTPVASPYFYRMRAYAYIRRFSPVLALLLVVVLTSGTLAYASERSLPGEKLYSLKVKLLEPARGMLALTPVQKLEWEEEKVTRRLTEAEDLARQDKLAEEEVEELGKAIEESSTAFAKKVEEVSLLNATSSDAKEAKERELKKSFEEKLEARQDDSREENKEKREKINRLKEKAVKALEQGKDRKD